MTRPTTHIAFNPDCMTVADLKTCARTLRGLIEAYRKHERAIKADSVHNADMTEEAFDKLMHETGIHVLQFVDRYEVD